MQSRIICASSCPNRFPRPIGCWSAKTRNFKYKLYVRELFRVAARCEMIPVCGSAYGHSQQLKMIKSLVALAILAVLGAAVVAVPAFAPQAKASETVALPKADRLEIRRVARDCSQQVWPNFGTSCLRKANSGATIQEVRLISARR